MHQLNINTIFLHGDLHKDVYTSLPSGLSPSFPNQVCKLVKSLYGLKQVSRHWHAKLLYVSLIIGYKQATPDHLLLIKHTSKSFNALAIYVDDVILDGNDMFELNIVKGILDKSFDIKDIGPLKYFLGLEVVQSKKGIYLNQRNYCSILLNDAGLHGCKPANTSLDFNLRL